jgi:hypothetical protein
MSRAALALGLLWRVQAARARTCLSVFRCRLACNRDYGVLCLGGKRGDDTTTLPTEVEPPNDKERVAELALLAKKRTQLTMMSTWTVDSAGTGK